MPALPTHSPNPPDRRVSTAELALSPRPELVRTARLMAVALARRSGVAEDVVQEVRIAVGEAVSRAVLVHGRAGSDEPVRLTFVDDEDGFAVRIRDVGDPLVRADVLEADVLSLSAEAVSQDLPPQLALAVIAGMADEQDVVPDPIGGTLVTLRWRR